MLLVLEVLGLRALGPTNVSEGLETEELSISPTLAVSGAVVLSSWILCLPLAVQEQLQVQFSSLGIGFTEALENTRKDRLLKPPTRVRSTPDTLTHTVLYSNQTHTEAPDKRLRGGRALQERGDRTHRSSPRTRGSGAPAGSSSPRPRRPEWLGRRGEHGLHSPFCLRDGVRFPARENKPTAPSPHRGLPALYLRGLLPPPPRPVRENE